MTHTPVRTALLLSLGVSCLSLGLKVTAFALTSSTAALSDAAESVVHLFAVMFVLYGYFLSQKPADEDHHYGHERVEFFSIGAEGAIIVIAGITIIYNAIESMIFGVDIANIGIGMLLMGIAAVINLVAGTYITQVGRRENSMITISNGKHTLTDVWTSGGVLLALGLIQLTGWLFIDIVVSLLIAGYIIREAYTLLRYSVRGLMDTRNPAVDRALRNVLKNEQSAQIKGWHHLRHRTSGGTTWVELHLVFEDDISLKAAHDHTTRLERKLIDALNTDAVVTIHLEPDEAHDESHNILKGANRGVDLDDFA